jgi:hypothetical protein
MYFSSEYLEDAGFYSFVVLLIAARFETATVSELLKEAVIMPLGPLRAP